MDLSISVVTSRSRTHKVPLGRSSIPLPQLNQTAPENICRENYSGAGYDEPRRRQWSASSQRLIVRRTRLRTAGAGDRAIGAAAPRLWNSLPAGSLHSRWQLSRNV